MTRSRIAFVCLAISFAVHASAATPKFRRSVDPIREQYIVVLNDAALTPVNGSYELAVEQAATELTRFFGGEAGARWFRTLRGFALRIDQARAILMSEHPLVRFVEEDSQVFVSGSQNTDFSLKHLDRIDQKTGKDNAYHWECPGSGVNIYIVDTGVLRTHREFVDITETLGCKRDSTLSEMTFTLRSTRVCQIRTITPPAMELRWLQSPLGTRSALRSPRVSFRFE